MFTSHKRTPATIRTITIVNTGIMIIFNCVSEYFNSKVSNLDVLHKYLKRLYNSHIISVRGIRTQDSDNRNLGRMHLTFLPSVK